MTHIISNILIKPIKLNSNTYKSIKDHISTLDWGVMLDSASSHHRDSRWSISSAEPIATLSAKANRCDISKRSNDFNLLGCPMELQENLRTELFNNEDNDKNLPFTGGAIGSYSYELGYQFEKFKLKENKSKQDFPDLCVGFYDWALLFDLKNKFYYLVQHNAKGNLGTLEEQWDKRFNWLINIATKKRLNFSLTSDWKANMTQSEYKEKFKRVKEYILAGDCYQVNLAQGFSAGYQGDEYQAYLTLLEKNTPPFAAFFRLPSQVILSISPERFLLSKKGKVTTDPIKGTTPRYSCVIKDDASKATLKSSIKDRAENLMIVDLMRNDLGKVCKIGTVKVPKLFEIISFPSVHHLVSRVTGQLKSKVSPEKLLKKCFPGGSITGAPKIRSMEIINELEPDFRNSYCGSVGYINGNGEMDLNIAIRTLVCKNNKIYCWAGGGLVADSKAQDEYQECFDKVSKILPCLSDMN